MQMELKRRFDRAGQPTRREFLECAAVLAVAGRRPANARLRQAPAKNGPILAYVGTYSSPQGPEGSSGNGQGIYLFEMNPSTGALKQQEFFPDTSNPSWLAFNSAATRLYAANETATYQGANSGSVSAFSIERRSGHLEILNRMSSGGAGPTHLSVHPSGRYVLVANYEAGSVAVLPILPGGQLGPATDVKEAKGTPGPEHATSAPAGGFAVSGHDRPHAHMIQADSSGRYVLASDLALDRIFIWKFDLERGTLSANNPAYVALPAGDGPRHFAFHPNGRWLYSLQEEGSTLVVFDYDSIGGRLSPRQTVSTLPKEFGGTNFPSGILVSPGGKYVYAANRLHNSIAVFSIGEAGFLKLLGVEWTRGDYPRSINIDPTGNFLCSCNQRSDAITTFRINPQTGRLTFTEQYTPVGSPAIIIFLG